MDTHKKAVKQPTITKSELDKIDRYKKERQTSSLYGPWVTVRQSNTHGQGQILTSHKAKHVVHLLSIGELHTFLKLEHDSLIEAIFEQFPLPINETMEIAKSLNILHPGNYTERNKHGNRIPAKTMTTDFIALIRSDEGTQVLSPYSFKYKSALSDDETSSRSVKRTKDKLKIEREYWRTQGAALRVVHEDFYCETQSYNFLFFRECFDYPEYIDQKSALYISALIGFKEQLKTEPKLTLKAHFEKVSEHAGIDTFHAQCVFQHAAYHKTLSLIHI